MKTSSTRSTQNGNQVSQLDRLVTVSPDSNLPLNVTMLYEDDQTREWAREAFDKVSKLAGEQPVRPTWWRLSNLGQPGVLAAASSTAMRADVVVIAVRAAEGLPLPFYAWTSAWAPHRLELNGVLVALLGAPSVKNHRSGRVGDFLRMLARQARMHLLLEQRSCSVETANGHANGHEARFAVRF